MTDRNNSGRKVDLVFEGGGVRGIALVGALAVLEEHGFEAQNMAGTSAGAIIATLSAAGYSAKELHDVMQELDFRQFTDRGWEDLIPIAGVPLTMLKDQGIYEGNAFLRWIRGLLEAREIRVFGDLIHPSFADEPRYRYKAQVIVSDITGHRLLVLPRDAPALGIEPEEMEVAEAVRMSMSIPIFFEPVRRKHAETGEEHLIVDGGLLSNFPVWLFDSEKPKWPTFGLMLTEPDPTAPIGTRVPEMTSHFGIGPLVDYLKDLVATMAVARDRMYIEQSDFARTIPISTLGVSPVDFGLSREKAEELHLSGREAAERFLSTWDFEAYVAKFRRNRPPSRRRMLVSYMHSEPPAR